MTDLKRILNALNEKYGRIGHSPIHRTEYVAIHKTDRKNCIYRLVKTMQMKDKDRTYFEMASVQDEIAEFFLPDLAVEGKSKGAIKGGRTVIKNELTSVIERVWPNQELWDGPLPEKKEEVIKEPEIKFAGREVNRDLYKKDSDYEPQLDEEFAALIGVKKDE